MKTQLSYIILLSLISFAFTKSTLDGENNDILRYREYFMLSSDFEVVLRQLFDWKEVRLTTIDLTEGIFEEGGFGYWDMIKKIDEVVDKEIKSISIILPPSVIERLKKINYIHILAEMAIATEQVKRIVPNFDINEFKANNKAYDAFINLHNELIVSKPYFDGNLFFALPSFTPEVKYYENFEYFEYYGDDPYHRPLGEPFIINSRSLYDYVFEGVDFSLVTSINFYHLSLYNYFETKIFSRLMFVNFDDSYYRTLELNEDIPEIKLDNYLEVFNKNSQNKMLVTCDESNLNVDQLRYFYDYNGKFTLDLK
jgi:hypothetical protein